jgi:hypothetical protein
MPREALGIGQWRSKHRNRRIPPGLEVNPEAVDDDAVEIEQDGPGGFC